MITNDKEYDELIKKTPQNFENDFLTLVQVPATFTRIVDRAMASPAPGAPQYRATAKVMANPKLAETVIRRAVLARMSDFFSVHNCDGVRVNLSDSKEKVRRRPARAQKPDPATA